MPCDAGGLDACPYWATHGASPGQPLLAINRLAVLWLRHIKRQGWEQTVALLDIAVTAYEASYLLEAWAMYEDFMRNHQQRARA